MLEKSCKINLYQDKALAVTTFPLVILHALSAFVTIREAPTELPPLNTHLMQSDGPSRYVILPDNITDSPHPQQ